CVDYVLDLQKEPLPFPDKSVEYVHSSHFLEHLDYPVKVFQEISRVCIENAQLEFWTPYTWSNSAFIYGHKQFFNEDHYLHMCVWNSSFWEPALKARWLLKEINYIIDSDVLIELHKNKIPLDFALKYYKGIVREFGVFIEVHHNYTGEELQPIKTFAVERSAKRYPVKIPSDANVNSSDLNNAFKWFSSWEVGQQLFPLPPTPPEELPSELQPNQAEVEGLQSQLQYTQAQLQQAQAVIAAMQKTKFWKLREAWLKFKKVIGKS
ncbi:MAG TPA: histidine kinase, partial [Cyanobacteria bacterium UBA8543]|nr:histidine kinase [Cyanobacteria bacterium UBA8543]